MFNILEENAIVKSFIMDEDFRSNTNKHKYIILWASKFHRLINRIMRRYPIEIIMKHTKYTRHFIKRMLQYFYTSGLNKTKLTKLGRHLYRGLTDEFTISKKIQENGFMSTTLDYSVAKKFAGNTQGGNILEFSISKLPENTAFVLINEDVADHLHEREILLLPGNITINKKSPSSGNIKANYTMNPLIVNIYHELITPHSAGGLDGGGDLLSELAKPKMLKLTDMRGVYVVWYRAILGRPVEVLNNRQLPK